MRIIQSIWTRPSLIKGFVKYNGGWPSLEDYLIAMAYSCLTWKSQFGNISLLTDDFGKYLLIEKLRLPYDDVSVDLNKILGHPGNWAISKLWHLSKHTEVSLHVDMDFFIWKKFSPSFNTLIAQNYERNLSFYDPILNQIKSQFRNAPPYLFENCDPNEVTAINTGIIGGTDIHFLKLYANDLLKFYEVNESNFKKIFVANLPLFDQYFLARIASNFKKQFFTIMTDKETMYEDEMKIDYMHKTNGFFHAMSESKLTLANTNRISSLFKSEFPEIYSRIENFEIN